MADDNGSQLAFARTSDHGTTWHGVGAMPVGTSLASDSFAPELSVAADGTIYIVWVAGTQIKFVKSTNGGDSFSAPAVATSGPGTPRCWRQSAWSSARSKASTSIRPG
jgi:hypothetical protein